MSAPRLRIALRTEGGSWVGYIAKPGTMEGGIEIARVSARAARESEQVHELFIALCQAVVDQALSATGFDVKEWNTPTPGPEGERSGNA